jgi:photosystem II stability/assembly factor-like uncharacterized protein
MNLLTRNTGWALMNGGLYWTNDFGQDWRNITPPLTVAGEGISGVFFLNTEEGWALIRTPRSETEAVVFGDWGFYLAHTDNAGASWTVEPVQLPDLQRWASLGGSGSIDFVGPTRGWMDLSLDGMLGEGVLLSTNDGGATWRLAHGSPTIAAAVRFVTPREGWLAGGQGGGSLYASHDGGRTWARVELRSPLQPGIRAFSVYDLPSFTGPGRGCIVVSDPWGRWLTLFETRNGGRTWAPVGSLAHLPPIGSVPAVAVDSKMIAGWTTRRDSITLAVVGAHGHKTKVTGSIQARGPGVPRLGALSFASPESGWALVDGELYSTTDGGSTWATITPGNARPQTPGAAPKGAPTAREYPAQAPGGGAGPTAIRATTADASASGGGSSIHTSTHLGFDSSTAPFPSSMKIWWSESPYYDYGFYLGGADTSYALDQQYGPGTADPSLTPAAWVGDVASYGWGLIPFWVGPQAPYQNLHHR